MKAKESFAKVLQLPPKSYKLLYFNLLGKDSQVHNIETVPPYSKHKIRKREKGREGGGTPNYDLLAVNTNQHQHNPFFYYTTFGKATITTLAALNTQPDKLRHIASCELRNWTLMLKNYILYLFG